MRSGRYTLPAASRLRSAIWIAKPSRGAEGNQSGTEKPGLLSHGIDARAALVDSTFLSLVTVMSVALYLFGLGFSSDDWSELAAFASAGDPSWLGVYHWMAADPQNAYRPVEMLYLTGVYELFGLNPTGYHLVSALALVAMGVLFYLGLREAGLPRLVAVAVPAVYVLLPHYSAERFWFEASGYTVSMALYFLSLWAGLRGLRSSGAGFWIWEALALAGMICSGLIHEVALPLYLLNVALIAYKTRLLRREEVDRAWRRTGVVLVVGANLLVLASIAVFKLLTTTRAGGVGTNYFLHVGKIALGASAINYGSYGVGLPLATLWLVVRHFNLTVVAASVLVGCLVCAYLYYLARRPGSVLPERRDWAALVITGLLAFVLGYVVFLSNNELAYSSTGIINRVYIAGAAGVALSFVGICGWAVSLLKGRRVPALCLLLALICLCGFAINNTLAIFWVRATAAQREVLDDIYRHVPSMQPGSTLILDGMCPYVGPAVVFYAPWDLQGALRLHYRDWTIRADIVSADLHVEETGLTTVLYKVARTHYPYNNKLAIYNRELKRLYPIPDAETARRYFETVDPAYSSRCPYSESGKGVQVLPWR